MAHFWRIYNNQIISSGEIGQLGWAIDEPRGIPEEYLSAKNFVVCRTAHSLGDWGIISAMPRLLKQKYPDCKVWIPSASCLQKIFVDGSQWGAWSNPFANPEIIFANNPYVDGFVDDIKDEIYHDHYRIYVPNDPELSLIIQMLLFWRFNHEELVDYLPELYFSDEEKKIGNEIITTFVEDRPFGCLMLSSTTKDRNEKQENKLLIPYIEERMPYFYYTSNKNNEILNIIHEQYTFGDIPLRIQLYIRTKAFVNIGYETGLTTMLCRYTNVISAIKKERINSNYFPNIKYLCY